MSIWVHSLVKNEERYIWFSVMSVINYVDKVMIWDTGSTDRTVEIIKKIQKTKEGKQKILFREVGEVDIDRFTTVRQEMINETKSDWIVLVDGDEVWWDLAIAELTDILRKKGDELESIVSRYHNVVGDIYHYQEEAAGKYEIDGKRGHITIRAMNREIPGINVSRPHGQQGFFDGLGKLIQERSSKQRLHLMKTAYIHFTHLPRSFDLNADLRVPKRRRKLKHELGKSFPLDFYYPEVFFRKRPKIVSCPWRRMNSSFYFRSAILTIPKKVKRRITRGSVGY
jgi:glycosyltransferase involved in cell wall biosynthesis